MNLKKNIYKLKAKFLMVFGNLRISKYPPFLYYDDSDFSTNGLIIREIMEYCKPGDIILRGYDNYCDSYFIKSSRKYSHAGIIVKKNKVIHATAPMVKKDDIIDFCRCDRVAIVRPKKYIRNAINCAYKLLSNNIPYDFNFTHGAEALYCFELAAYCYPKLDIQKLQADAMFGLIKKKEFVYLSDSFFNSKDFELIYEFNPKFNIHFKG